MYNKNENATTMLPLSTGSTSTEMVQVLNSIFPVEYRNGQIAVNLTAMGKPYGNAMKPTKWLRTDEAVRYLEALSVGQKCPTADLLEVRQGGTFDKQGTWCYDYRIALRYAQWLSPQFSILVDSVFLEMVIKQRRLQIAPLKNGVKPIIYDGVTLYPYNDTLRSLGASTRGSTSKRKAKFPQCFVMIGGRNYITGQYFDLLQGYYNYRNAQLSLSFSESNLAIGEG